MTDKDLIKKQFDDKTGTYLVIINIQTCGLNITSHLNLYLNFNRTINDLKNMFFTQLKMYHNNIIFDETNLLKSIEINGNMNGLMKSNIHQLPNKTKIKDFECIRPIFTFILPRCIQIQIDNDNAIFVFNADSYITEINKLLKKTIGLDLTKCSYNEKPIPTTEKCMSIFNTYGVNTIKKVQIKPVENSNTNYGSIYLIQTREFQTQSIPIYKIGKTGNDISERLGKYGKGGQVLFTIAIELSKLDNIEYECINLLKSKFIQKENIGTEYFEGDFKDMIKMLYQKCIENI